MTPLADRFLKQFKRHFDLKRNFGDRSGHDLLIGMKHLAKYSSRSSQLDRKLTRSFTFKDSSTITLYLEHSKHGTNDSDAYYKLVGATTRLIG